MKHSIYGKRQMKALLMNWSQREEVWARIGFFILFFTKLQRAPFCVCFFSILEKEKIFSIAAAATTETTTTTEATDRQYDWLFYDAFLSFRFALFPFLPFSLLSSFRFLFASPPPPPLRSLPLVSASTWYFLYVVVEPTVSVSRVCVCPV